MDVLLRRAHILLDVEEEHIRSQLDNMMMDKKLVIKGDCVFAASYYYAELNCARMLMQLNIPMGRRRVCLPRRQQWKSSWSGWRENSGWNWMSCSSAR